MESSKWFPHDPIQFPDEVPSDPSVDLPTVSGLFFFTPNPQANGVTRTHKLASQNDLPIPVPANPNSKDHNIIRDYDDHPALGSKKSPSLLLLPHYIENSCVPCVCPCTYLIYFNILISNILKYMCLLNVFNVHLNP